MIRRGFSTVSGRTPVIVSYARTPIGKLNGALSSKKGSELGAVAVRAAVDRACLQSAAVSPQEVILGNVVSAGMGQAPARQAAKFAGLPDSVCCTTINKVCASGMKSVMLASASVLLGHRDCVVAGGFESMSNIPYYNLTQRAGAKFGHTQLLDGIIHDGLWDAYGDQHMGMCAEKCASDYAISRSDQDAYCLESYSRAKKAQAEGVFDLEMVPVEVGGVGGKDTPIVVALDEEPGAVKESKIPELRAAFMRQGGTVTAGNASSINDGASAMVVMSYERAAELGLKPLAAIRGFADAEQAPVDFTTAPALAVPLALKQAGLELSDCDLHEINEAFSVVALANMQLLNLDPTRGDALTSKERRPHARIMENCANGS
mmetsp:Transcript_35983/g.80931  ORF Transcript_35983/g.80931 Transcript_35983/m.80931 type:complete len:375 (-) Transcript_35983:88-1212(-)